MSALGQKRTYAAQNVMSTLHPKADMCGATKDVRFGPIADIRKGILFDQIVSTSEERRRNGESECLGGLEIDSELIFGRKWTSAVQGTMSAKRQWRTSCALLEMGSFHLRQSVA
jgi:hypothetical protein